MISDEISYYNIETLARLAEVTRRTIRYYVQRGLIPKPEGGGRGHYYTDEHLNLIERIKAWKMKGVPLAKIKELTAKGAGVRFMARAREPVCVREPESVYAPRITSSQWIKTQFGENIELLVRPGALNDEDKKAIEDFITAKIKK